ncbi:cuticle protein 38-like [Uloborus diversus]|uniref:cuticle protein 38-like n=1 Tax=Uloborus diversus TaxID=327109 RepID=UPI00240A332E|nr:cuticle protein 38-like [Uloborus diversus]
MIAKIAFLCATLAAARSTGLLAPAVYGHGLAIKAPAAPVLAAPLLSKTVLAAPHPYAPYAKHIAPLPYATVAKAVAPVTYTTTITKTAPVAPILSHAGLLGAAPLAYSGLYGHGLAHGPGLLAHGPALTYAPGLHGVAYAPTLLNHGKILL